MCRSWAQSSAARMPAPPESRLKPENMRAPQTDPAQVVGVAATAMENGDYDKAIFLLKQAKSSGYISRFINLDKILEEAETALERQTHMREAERDYRQIAELVRHKSTHRLGCEALTAFFIDFPDYDPENLKAICQSNADTLTLPPIIRKTKLPSIEWCEIPEGKSI